jgi:hypothetical protein
MHHPEPKSLGYRLVHVDKDNFKHNFISLS